MTTKEKITYDYSQDDFNLALSLNDISDSNLITSLSSNLTTKKINSILKVLNNSKDIDLIQSKLEKIVDKDKARIFCLGLEMGKRKFQKKTTTKIQSSIDIVNLLKPYRSCSQENFIVIALNSAGEVIKVETISIGLINQTVIHPRELFLRAIELKSVNIIVAHNHPTGDTKPSKNDIGTTQTLIDASKIIGIKILDHIIIGSDEDDNYFSFADNGII